MIREISLGLYEKALPNALLPEEKLELAGRAGFDYLELSIDETDEKLARLAWEKDELIRIRRACERTGIPVRSVCLSGHRRYPLGSRDSAVRARSAEILRQAVRLAVRLGARTIQLAGYDVYYEQGGKDTQEYFAENLNQCVQYAAREGVILGFETMETPFMNTVEKAMRYVRSVDSPFLQVYPDVGNLTNGTQDVAKDLEFGRGHIVAAHLKETKPGVFRNLEYGQGRVDFPRAVSALYRLGVRMCVCEFWYDGKTEPLEYLRRNKKYIAQAIGEAEL